MKKSTRTGGFLIKEVAEHHGKPFETIDLHKDGTRIPVEVTNNRLEEAGLYLSIVRDIRDRKHLEKELLKIEKLQSLGVLAGGMGGKETVQKLLNLDPNVRAIVSSGYSNDPVMANYSKYDFCAAVKKPYQIQNMSRALHAVVHAQPKKNQG